MKNRMAPNPDSDRLPFPSVTVVIPSLHGRDCDLDRLRRTVLDSSLPVDRVEILAAIGVVPNGRARDVAVVQSRGDYLILIDDDASFPDASDLRTLVEFMEGRSDVGLAGPAQQIPPSLSRSIRQRARQIPRQHVEAPSEFRETDMVTHACMIIRRSLFRQVGMEHPNLISGTDPDLRRRVRERGYKVGLVPNTRVYHPPVKGWWEWCTTNYQGGRNSCRVRRDYPGYHLKTPPDGASGAGTRNSILQRVAHHLNHLGQRLGAGQVWALIGQLGYLAGYFRETLLPTDPPFEPIPYPDPPTPEHPEWPAFEKALQNEGTVRWLHRPTVLKGSRG